MYNTKSIKNKSAIKCSIYSRSLKIKMRVTNSNPMEIVENRVNLLKHIDMSGDHHDNSIGSNSLYYPPTMMNHSYKYCNIHEYSYSRW